MLLSLDMSQSWGVTTFPLPFSFHFLCLNHSEIISSRAASDGGEGGTMKGEGQALQSAKCTPLKRSVYMLLESYNVVVL